MAHEDVVTLTEASFRPEVLESATPALVDFWAPWCAPCRALAPTIDAIAGEFAGRLKVAKLNVDEAPQIAEQYGVQSIPTLLVFRGGQIVQQLVGAVPKARLVKAIEGALKAGAPARLAG